MSRVLGLRLKHPVMHALDPAWDALKRDFDEAVSQSARAARHQLAHELNQLVRRLRNYRNEAEWLATVLDGAACFAKETALFLVVNDRASLRAEQGLNLPPDLSFDLKSAAAFASAVDSKDPVVALRSEGEVGTALSSPDASARAHIFPVLNGARVVALIFAAGSEYLDVNALELLGSMASAVLERQSNAGLHARIATLADVRPEATNGTAAPAAAPPKTPVLPAWAELSEQERTIHLKAQRFSRVTVAEMQLARPEACRAGRSQKNLYLFLKQEIDKARDAYRRQYMTIPSMVDYLHLELVRTAAEGDEIKLGADYPGQMV